MAPKPSKRRAQAVAERPAKKAGAAKKPKAEAEAEAEAGGQAKGQAQATPEPWVAIIFPPVLKRQLVDDNDQVKAEGRLLKLPRKPNVAAILQEYAASKRSRPGAVAQAFNAPGGLLDQMLEGVQLFFDKCLEKRLLYDTERAQFARVLGKDGVPSNVYGAEHLLRLFVLLPDLMEAEGTDARVRETLSAKLQDLIKYLAKHHTALFLSEHECDSAPKAAGAKREAGV